MKKQRKVFFTIHPKYNVMFTIGEDDYLRVWNTEKHTNLKSVALQFVPTSIACHPGSGDVLMIGFNNGEIFQYDSNIPTPTKNNQRKTTYHILNFHISKLELIIPEFDGKKSIFSDVKKPKIPVLSLVFSKNGQYLAASYGFCLI